MLVYGPLRRFAATELFLVAVTVAAAVHIADGRHLDVFHLRKFRRLRNPWLPVPMQPTVMRLLGAVAPRTEAGTSSGAPPAAARPAAADQPWEQADNTWYPPPFAGIVAE